MIRVGVLRGGTSNEFEVSIKSGGNILASLPKDSYSAVDIFIARDGTWNIGGIPRRMEDIPLHIDVAFNALHGDYGEDGKISRALEELKIPYTGSEAVPSSLALNKNISREILKKAGIKVPPGVAIEDYRESLAGGDRAGKVRELALKIFSTIPPPWILKPARGGSSINTKVAKTFKELISALYELFDYGGDLVVEQYIRGKEVSSGVIDGFRREKHYPLMPVEVRNKKDIFDHIKKQSPDLTCPSFMSREEKDSVSELAVRAHNVLGLRDWSVSDFIVTSRGIYLLEINNNPKCAPCSIMAKSLEAVGSNIGELADHLIKLALNRK
ncbi:MAG: ATP-grasp domain-containing protein [Patescibacteria group bacterium]|mgnify:CR=1 FL=1